MNERWRACFAVIGGAVAIADGATTSLLGFFNVAGSPFRIRVRVAKLMTASIAAVTGVGIEINLRRLSAFSSGTAGALVPLNTGNKADPLTGELPSAYITVATGGTTTALDTFAYRSVNNDEAALTGQSDVIDRAIWRAEPDAPLILNAGEGADIYQVTSSTAGAWIPEFIIDVERK